MIKNNYLFYSSERDNSFNSLKTKSVLKNDK